MSRSWLGAPGGTGWVGIDGRVHGGRVSRVHELPRRVPADVFTERLSIVEAEPGVTPGALFVDQYAEPPTLPPAERRGPAWFAADPVPVPPPNSLLYAAGTLDRTGQAELIEVGRWLQSWAVATHRPAEPGQATA